VPAGKLIMTFKKNRRFKKKYDWLYKKDPMGANMFLLLCELADEKGQVMTSEAEISELMPIRFNDPEEYAL
jgi:hypothetical protein